MVKINFPFAWQAIKAFECGFPLQTKVSHETFTQLNNAPDVLRYFYRIYCDESTYKEIMDLLAKEHFPIK